MDLESSGVVGFDLGHLLIIYIYVLCKYAEKVLVIA